MNQIVATVKDDTLYITMSQYDENLVSRLYDRGARKLRGDYFVLPMSVLNIQFAQKLGAQWLPEHLALVNQWLDRATEYRNSLETVPRILSGDLDAITAYGYSPKIAPYRHQRIGVSMMVSLHHLGLFLDCGAGKTGTVLLFLDLLQRKILKRPIKALVAGKLMSLYSGWKGDCEKFTDLACDVLWEPTKLKTTVLSRTLVENPDRQYFGEKEEFVDGTTLPKGTLIRSKTATVVLHKRTGEIVYLAKKKDFKPTQHEKVKFSWKYTPEGAILRGSIYRIDEKHENLRKESISSRILDKDNTASLFVINHDGARLFEEDLAKVPWDVVVIDESTMIKSHTSKLFKAMCRISYNAPYRFILSGTPAPNGPEDLWSQMFFLDRGITLGDSYRMFMEKHFTKLPMKMGKHEFVKWLSNEDTLKWVASRLDGRHYRVSLRDCADLPPLTVQVKDVYMTPAQQQAYHQMREDLITQIEGETVEAKTALVKLSKLRQITGGFVFNTTGQPVALDPNPKLDACVEFITELIAAKEQVVIFAVHVEEIKALLEAIPNSVGVYGEIGDEQKFGNVKDFIDGKVPVVVCQPQSAAHALTFVNSRYLVFYSIDYSAERNYQAIKRIERITQTRAMFVYYFLMHGSIDKIIYRVINKKIRSQSALIDGLSGSGASTTVASTEADDAQEILNLFLEDAVI